MKRCDIYDVLHVENYAALCIAICRAESTNVEDAFLLYEDGTLTKRCVERSAKERVREMLQLRAEGLTWPQIGEIVGLKAPQSYLCHRQHLIAEIAIEGQEEEYND